MYGPLLKCLKTSKIMQNASKNESPFWRHSKKVLTLLRMKIFVEFQIVLGEIQQKFTLVGTGNFQYKALICYTEIKSLCALYSF